MIPRFILQHSLTHSDTLLSGCIFVNALFLIQGLLGISDCQEELTEAIL